MKSKITATVLTCLLALALAVPALAGGWATITLEQLPAGAVAGQPLDVRFVVRQHGITLMGDLTPTISARNAETGESISFSATPVDGQSGHYQASLTFPSPGSWEWSIQAFTMDQRMPDLVVSASASGAETAQPAPFSLPGIAALAALALVLAAAALIIRKQPRWALGLVILSLLVGGAGLASAASKEKNANQTDSTGQTAPSAETGQALFVAKGCVTCHVNNRIDNKYVDFRSDLGPNLSKYAASPEFLRMWLNNPAAVRPETKMPDLELSEAEIEALIAFLNGNSSPATSPATATPEALQQVITATPSAKQAALPTPAQKKSASEKSACSNMDRSHGLLVSYSRDADSYLTLVDPSTGEPLCGVEHIDLGTGPTYAYAPDRSALAALGAETPAQKSWRLYWIDLLTWKVVDTGVTLDSWSQGIATNPQRPHLAIIYSRLSKGVEPKLLGFNLAVVDVSGKGILTEAELDISPRLVAYSGDGRSILVYGASYDYVKGTSTSHAKVRLYSAFDLSLIWSAELSDVLEGVFKTGDEKNFEPDQYTQWQPALALSPDQEKLYIVQADADRLTTVDLASHRANTIEIRPRLSWIERLLRLTSSVAHAKGLNGTIKQAVLSPDGSRLYLTGSTGHIKKDQGGNWLFDEQPFGLQVIDTSDGSEIARMKTEAREIDLSVDGNTIFLRGGSNQSYWTDILDASTLETIDHLDGLLLYPAQTLSGESWVVGGPNGQWVQGMTVYDRKGYTPVSDLQGNGYWISIP